MDGSFACPECGSEVEIAGLAPGRQVRCGFCDRLLEVPYLPRVPVAGWKRRRFGHLKWVRWAWAGIGVTAAVALIFGTIQFLGRQYHLIQEGSINKLIESSRAREAEGRFDLAVVDLDAALDLARRSGVSTRFPVVELRRRRAELATREVEGLLAGLERPSPQSYPLGDWLNLVARAGKDPDLAPLKPRIETKFRASLRQRAATGLETACRERDTGRFAAALRACDRVATLLPHMPGDVQSTFRREAEGLVAGLVETHGVALETPRGVFVLGSPETYRSHLVPVLVEALEAKGYLPYRETSPWKSAWRKARYVMTIEVSERFEDNYLSSENRLTRIEVQLILTGSSSHQVVWRTKPTARTTVPLPRLPVGVSGRAAASARSAVFERLLYDNARGQIDEKIAQNLGHIRECCP
jgi:hypothetical protein